MSTSSSPTSVAPNSVTQMLRELRPTFNGLRLLVFPTLEVLLIVLAWRAWSVGWWASALLVVLAGAAVSYSLHIVFHEVVHRRFFRHPVTRLVSELSISALLGTPFNEYRQSHWRHHRFTNLLEDSTSTWRSTPSGPKPRSFLGYSFGWPLLSPGSFRALVEERRSGRLSTDAIVRMLVELGFLGCVHVALAATSLTLWAAYAATVYMGWTFIAAVNYLQHPPREYGTGFTTSVYSPAYNRIFYNNGLHFEHHEQPQAPVIELSPHPGDFRLYREGRRVRREVAH